VRASAATRSDILEAFHQMVCAVAHDLAKTHAWPGAQEW
jgi:hypothetical protein